MVSIFCLLLFFSLCAFHINGLNVSCQYNFTNNVSYDASSILAGNNTLNFIFVNGTALPQVPTYYLFNLCGNISATPNVTTCYNSTARNESGLEKETGYCPSSNITNTTCSTSLTNIQTPVAAYEIVNGTDCYRLNDGVTTPNYSVINIDNPVLGFYIRYTQGDFCPVGNTNRGFTMIFLCDGYNKFVQEINVVEDPVCSYTYTIRSIYACPTQCLHNNKICGNNGACIYDSTIASARCLCTQVGATGTWCENGLNSTNITNINGSNITNSSNVNVLATNNNDHRWKRWIGILLACLAALFLCCCLLALLALLALCRKHKGNKDDRKRSHDYEVPNSSSPERVPIASRHTNDSNNV